jgi:hypothetical protein
MARAIVFRVHPVFREPPFYKCFVYPTAKDMALSWKRRRRWDAEGRAAVDFEFEAVTHRDIHREQAANGNWAKLPQLGEIYFYAGGVTHDTVAHEMSHAALLSLSSAASSKPVIDADERIAERAGNLCGEFWKQWGIARKRCHTKG